MVSTSGSSGIGGTVHPLVKGHARLSLPRAWDTLFTLLIAGAVISLTAASMNIQPNMTMATNPGTIPPGASSARLCLGPGLGFQEPVTPLHHPPRALDLRSASEGAELNDIIPASAAQGAGSATERARVRTEGPADAAALVAAVEGVPRSASRHSGGVTEPPPITGRDVDLASVDALNHQLGTDRPLLVQYFEYLWDAVRFKFGTTITDGQTIGSMRSSVDR